MELPLYSGTWITCGAYAFLHGAELDGKLLLPIETVPERLSVWPVCRTHGSIPGY